MIEALQVVGVPAFEPDGATFGPLTAANIVFGANGAGKTSLTRALDSPSAWPESVIARAASSSHIGIRVFNRDYVTRTFGEAAELPGVFVLGEESLEAQNERAKLTAEAVTLRRKLSSAEQNLGDASTGEGKRGQLETLNSRLADAIWDVKNKLPDELSPAFAGFHASKAKLRERVVELRRAEKQEAADVATLTSLATAVYDERVPAVDELKEMPIADLQTITRREIWKQSIRGASDISIAELIQSLNNPDWVRQGRAHLAHSDGVCPFCQQSVPGDLANQLDAYFGAAYEAQMSVLETSCDQLDSQLYELEAAVRDALLNGGEFLDSEPFAAEAATVQATIDEYRHLCAAKRSAPSVTVDLPDLAPAFDRLNRVIERANARIREHNRLVSDRSASARNLTNDIWAWLVWEELDAVLKLQLAAASRLQAAITGLSSAAAEYTDRLHQIDSLMEVLAQSTQSSQPTINGINRMLAGAGFSSFKLDHAEELLDGYRIIRDDGSAVRGSLSEGEQSFVGFLYFLQEIRGIDPATGQAPEIVVVIDDPISSLDSSSLFFVSSKTRELALEALGGDGQVKQLIVLTHNVYFHKEVAYGHQRWPNRSNLTFHLIEKRESTANLISASESNPISTTYALLWKDVREARTENRMSTGIQNSMRRIVESFFGFTGGQGVNELPDLFEGDDRTICRSLISWVHDGSHSTDVLGTLHYSPLGDTPEAWLRIFESIFEQSGSIDHFNMMMTS